MTKQKKGANKAEATIKAMAPGKATVKVTVKGKFNKKNYKSTFTCKVKVNGDAPAVVTDVPVNPTSAPVNTPTDVPANPTEEPTKGPTPDPTEEPTPLPTRDPSVTAVPGTELELGVDSYHIPSWVSGVTATKNEDGSLTIDWSEEAADYANIDFIFKTPQNLSSYKKIIVETAQEATFHIKITDAKKLDEYDQAAAVGIKYNASFPYEGVLADIVNTEVEGADYTNVKGISIQKDTGTAPRTLTIRSIRFVRGVEDILPGEDVTVTPNPTNPPSGNEKTLELSVNNYHVPSWLDTVSVKKNTDGTVTLNWDADANSYDNIDFYFDTPQDLSGYEKIVVETTDSKTFHIKILDAAKKDSYDMAQAVGIKYNAQFPYEGDLATILNTKEVADADYTNVKGISIMKDTQTTAVSLTIKSIKFVGTEQAEPQATPTAKPSSTEAPDPEATTAPTSSATATEAPSDAPGTNEVVLDVKNYHVPSWLTGITATENSDGTVTVNWAASTNSYDNIDFYFDTPQNLSGYEKIVVETTENKTFHIKILDAAKKDSYDLAAAVGIKYNAQFPYEGDLATILNTKEVADADYTNVKGISIMKDTQTTAVSLTIKSIKFVGTGTVTPPVVTPSDAPEGDAVVLDVKNYHVPSWLDTVSVTENTDGTVTLNWAANANSYDNIDFYFDSPMDLSGCEKIVVETTDSKTFHIKILDAMKKDSYDMAQAVGIKYNASFPYEGDLAAILNTKEVSDADYTYVKGISIMKDTQTTAVSLTVKSIKFIGKGSLAPQVTPTVAPPTEVPPTAPPKATAMPETVTVQELSLADGNIIIDEAGYTVGAGEKQEYVGAYKITGASSNSIKVTGGTHDITLSDATSNSPSGASPIALSGNAKVTLRLEGISRLTAPNNHAGIEVVDGTEITICGDGTLFANGGSSSAGIGASSTGNTATTLGKIIINSGTIVSCNVGRNGAGIGDAQSGKGGGEIYITGGNIYATSSGNGAGIGSGGSAANNPSTTKIYIYGGLITAGGSAYEIGDGRNQSHCVVHVFGGAFRAANSKTLFGSVHANKGEYAKYSVEVKNMSGIKSVTIDGVDQGISSFYITDNSGNVNSRYSLDLYVSTKGTHEIIVTDTEGTAHTYTVNN